MRISIYMLPVSRVHRLNALSSQHAKKGTGTRGQAKPHAVDRCKPGRWFSPGEPRGLAAHKTEKKERAPGVGGAI